MSTISFTIPASSGVVVSDTIIIGDKGASIGTKPRVKLAKYGDGYEQRLAKGINSLDKNISLSFSPRTKEEIDDIIDYFEFLKGVTSFTLSLPSSNAAKSLEVVAEEWEENFAYNDFYTASVKLRKVNEA